MEAGEEGCGVRAEENGHPRRDEDNGLYLGRAVEIKRQVRPTVPGVSTQRQNIPEPLRNEVIDGDSDSVRDRNPAARQVDGVISRVIWRLQAHDIGVYKNSATSALL